MYEPVISEHNARKILDAIIVGLQEHNMKERDQENIIYMLISATAKLVADNSVDNNDLTQWCNEVNQFTNKMLKNKSL